MLKKGVLWFFVIFISVQIFSFSSATGTTSESTSKKVANVVVEVVKKVHAIPDGQTSDLFKICHYIVRKAAHFTEFMLLAVFAVALLKSYHLTMRYALLFALLYCLLFAAADEFHQLFVDGRSGRIQDVCIDFAGALTGAAAFVLRRKVWWHFCQKKEK